MTSQEVCHGLFSHFMSTNNLNASALVDAISSIVLLELVGHLSLVYLLAHEGMGVTYSRVAVMMC